MQVSGGRLETVNARSSLFVKIMAADFSSDCLSISLSSSLESLAPFGGFVPGELNSITIFSLYITMYLIK